MTEERGAKKKPYEVISVRLNETERDRHFYEVGYQTGYKAGLKVAKRIVDDHIEPAPQPTEGGK